MKAIQRLRQNVLALLFAGIVTLCSFIMFGCSDGFEERFVQFTDLATEKSYDIGKGGSDEVRIPYDGLEHTFSYIVLSTNGYKKLGQSGTMERSYNNKIAKNPGVYSYEVVTKQNHYSRTFVMVLVIEESETTN